jgi:preprotein translocase subunit SecF
VIIVLGLASLGIRGFNLGIDFKGGSSWTVQSTSTSVSAITASAQKAGLSAPIVEKLGSKTYEVTADINNLSQDAQTHLINKVANALAKTAHTNSNNVSIESVGPTWGGQITHRALEALIIFFIAVVAYISIRFEPKMAAAAFIAMVHDLLVTVGVYSLFGLQITPDTVIAILTILGYSLYDTVVVFDRVRDNTNGVLKGGGIGRPRGGRRHSRGHHLAELRFGPLRRSDERCLLIDLHRESVARGHEGARAPLPRLGGARVGAR